MSVTCSKTPADFILVATDIAGLQIVTDGMMSMEIVKDEYGDSKAGDFSEVWHLEVSIRVYREIIVIQKANLARKEPPKKDIYI